LVLLSGTRVNLSPIPNMKKPGRDTGLFIWLDVLDD